MTIVWKKSLEGLHWDELSAYEKLGFRRMTTAMAIFQDQERAAADGYINET